MTRFLSLAALTGAALLLPVAATAEAPAIGGYYSATPVAKPTKTSFIVNSTVWKWTDTAFTANRASSRDAILCEGLVQRVGTLSAFSAAGRSFDGDALAKCNAHAK